MNTITVRVARQADAQEVAHIHVDTWRTTYRGLMPDSVLDGLSYERSQAKWESFMEESDRVLLVAEVPDEDEETEGGPCRRRKNRVVGFAAAGPAMGTTGTSPSAREGEIYAIYVLKGCQRQGIGSMLLQAAAAHLHGLGLNTMIVRVLSENPYRAFYERLGARPVGTEQLQIAGVVLAETVYRWLDTAALRSRAGPAGSPSLISRT
jgi:ribosomal protein S18 acetylase RimI-like enzyme